jgi:hypothetical protein
MIGSNPETGGGAAERAAAKVKADDGSAYGDGKGGFQTVAANSISSAETLIRLRSA